MFTFEFKIIKSVKLTSLSSESRVFFFLLDQTGLKGAMNNGERCKLTRVYTTASGEGLQNKSVEAQVSGPFVRLHFKTFFQNGYCISLIIYIEELHLLTISSFAVGQRKCFSLTTFLREIQFAFCSPTDISTLFNPLYNLYCYIFCVYTLLPVNSQQGRRD